jgi:hypothetical protein
LSAEQRSSYDGRSERGERVAPALLEPDPGGVVARLGRPAPATSASEVSTPALSQAVGEQLVVQLALLGVAQRDRRQQRRSHGVDDDPADRQADWPPARGAVDRLLHRHLLQQRHEVDAVCGERNTAMTPSDWVLSGPTLASPPISELMLRNRAMRPVGGASRTTAS